MASPSDGRTGRGLKLVSGLAFAAILALSGTQAAAAAPPAFDDVQAGHPFYDEIGWAAAHGIANGYDDGTFRPTRPVSRQAAVAFMRRLWLLAGGTDTNPPDPGFSDVPPTHPFYDDIAWAADLGITSGYGDGTFKPTRATTRQAMVAFLHRLWLAMGNTDPDPVGDPGFTDVSAGHPFYDDIAWAADLGITNGYGDGTFRPSRIVTRQAAVAFLSRLARTFGLWLVVDTPLDANDASPGDGICDIGDGTCSLRAAVEESNAVATPDVISLATGVDPTLTVAGTNEDAAATGDLDTRGSLTINGSGGTLDANGLDRAIDHQTDRLTITDMTVTGGSATGDAGGGIFSRGGTLEVRNSTITGNSAVLGSGISSRADSVTVTNTTIIDNDGAYAGGGIRAANGIWSITGSRIADNTAYIGGGINNFEATVAIINTTIVDNSAQLGGGIDNNGTLTVTHSTIATNTAEYGSGIKNSESRSATLRSTVVSLSAAGEDCFGPITSNGFNLDGDGSCLFDDPSDSAPQNPLLAPLGDNGGSTLTRMPYQDSPLVDAVPPGVNGCGTTVAKDQRGVLRPRGTGCDIGAVEGTGPISPPSLTFTVDTGSDVVDATPGDRRCDIGDGTCSLRAAIQETNKTLSSDTITIAAGVDPVLTIAGTGEDDAATGDLDIRGWLTIAGNNRTVDAQGIDRVINNLSGQLDIADITLTGGATATGGSAIDNDHGMVTVDNSVITGNTTSSSGATIFSSGGKMVVSNTAITGNTGSGISSTNTAAAVASSTITNNTEAGIESDGDVMAVSGTSISDNGAAGLTTFRGEAVVADSVLSNNAGSGVAASKGTLTLTNSTVSGNSATNRGGGVYTDGGTTTIRNVTISANNAVGGGGGIYAGTGTTTVENTTISGNTAVGEGGGVLTHGSLSITQSTVVTNTGGFGSGGIYNSGGTVTVLSSVVASNAGADCIGPVASGGYNLDGDDSCGFDDPTDPTAQDPLLGPLADNGGPTLTHLPHADSPLVNAVPPGANGCGTTMVTDQRGLARPAGPGCDIGAVEGTGPPSPPP